MSNPFFEPYNTPHDTVPFDRIKLEHFEEAFMEGIRRENEQIDRIVKYISQYERIVVCGKGSSGIAAEEMELRFGCPSAALYLS